MEPELKNSSLKDQPDISPIFEEGEHCYEERGVRIVRFRKWHKIYLNKTVLKGKILLVVSRGEGSKCKLPILSQDTSRKDNLTQWPLRVRSTVYVKPVYVEIEEEKAVLVELKWSSEIVVFFTRVSNTISDWEKEHDYRLEDVKKWFLEFRDVNKPTERRGEPIPIRVVSHNKVKERSSPEYNLILKRKMMVKLIMERMTKMSMPQLRVMKALSRSLLENAEGNDKNKSKNKGNSKRKRRPEVIEAPEDESSPESVQEDLETIPGFPEEELTELILNMDEDLDKNSLFDFV